MSKMKQIAALTAMLVVVIMYASPAKSAVCFLPDDDGSCGGGDIEISDDSTSENQCADFNLSQNQRNSKEYDSDCYSCEPCTYNSRTTYKCALKNGATWYGGNLSVCCTGGEKYFSKQGRCCPTTGCTCSGGRVWNPSTEQCECPEGKEFVGGVCTCAGNTVPDSDGNCILPAGCTYEYRQATTNDSCGHSEVIGSDDSCVYALLSKVKSVYFIGQSRDYKSGSSTLKSYLVNVAINRISNTSATCVDENKVTKYQTICEGTPESLCKNEGDEFIPNGCVSDTYNNGFEVKGDKWGTCKKASICKYRFAQLTTLETHSLSKLEDPIDNLNAYNYDKIHDLFSRFQSQGINKSASYYDAGNKDYHVYNRISKDSKTCYDDNHQLRYETICTDHDKKYCDAKEGRIFTRTCTSEEYNVKKLKVESMEFGTCECNLDERLYETNDDCMKAHESQSLKCTKRDSDWCYQTCEDAGMYSSEDACKTNAPKYTECNPYGSCYKRNKIGWGIHYTHKVEKESNRTYNCIRETHGSNSTYTSSVSWSVYVMNGDNYNQAQALNGNKYQRIDDHEGEVRYPAGKYKICFDQSYAGSRGNISIYYMHLAKRSGDWCDYHWNDSDSQWHAAENNKEFCSDAIIFTSSTACIIATFEDNTEYYVEGSFKVIEGERDGVYTYTCTQAEYAPY